MKTPIERFVDSVVKCLKCGAAMGACDCWTKCSSPGCTWSFERGGKCRNSENHKKLKQEYLNKLLNK